VSILFGCLVISMGFASYLGYRFAPVFAVRKLGFLQLLLLTAVSTLAICYSLLFLGYISGLVQLPENEQNFRFIVFASWAMMTWISLLLVPFIVLVVGWFFSQARIMVEEG